MELKKASFFDIDGTLMSGIVMVSFPYFLEKINLFDKESLKKYDLLINSYKKEKITYRELGLKIPKIYSRGLQGKRAKDIKNACNDFSEQQKPNIYTFSKNLINLMKTISPVIAITGSPIEPISALNKEFGFNDIHATEFEIIDGLYTGNTITNMILKETKEKTIHKIAEKNNLNLKQCFGFGDTEQDIAILKTVGYPVAINPNKELKEYAVAHNWPIFNKNDDVTSKIKEIINNGTITWNQ